MNTERPRGQDPTSELRHRTANTFQLLGALARMRSQRAGDAETARQLLWVADAIGSLGALERHRTDGGVELSGYLAEMIPVWRRRYGGSAAQVEITADRLVAPDSMASTLALIAQELIGNALTHGYPPGAAPGRVQVRLKTVPDGRYELAVIDDGVGFLGERPASEHFGLWIVRSLAAQVRGDLEIRADAGVTARLVFSL